MQYTGWGGKMSIGFDFSYMYSTWWGWKIWKDRGIYGKKNAY